VSGHHTSEEGATSGVEGRALGVVGGEREGPLDPSGKSPDGEAFTKGPLALVGEAPGKVTIGPPYVSQGNPGRSHKRAPRANWGALEGATKRLPY
jgi:hypothetical protein